MQSKIALSKDVDLLYLVCTLVEKNIERDYILYENNGRYLLGLGIESYIDFYSEKTIIHFQGERQEFLNDTFSKSIIRATGSILQKKWRGFAIANFELSRYVHSTSILAPESLLFKIVIPKLQISFSEDGIILESSNNDLRLQFLNIVQKKLQGDFQDNLLSVRVKKDYDIASEVRSFGSEKYKEIVALAVTEMNDLQYQKVILSRKVLLNNRIDMVASYFSGRKANTPARSFLLRIGDLQAAGFSPETVIEVDSKKMVSTQPLAGTRAVVEDSVEDKRLEDELVNDAKEIAEHAVSVKLAFEEMQKVCNRTDIFIDDFMSVIPRGRVRHLGSRLRGKLKEKCNSWDAFCALFPAVTATGIPKKESIEAISRYEDGLRDLYSGCVMICDSEGCIDAALVLRSFYQTSQDSWLRAGAGLVPKSTPERELEETCEKLSAVAGYLKFQ